MVKQEDVTGTTVLMDEEKVRQIIFALSPEQRQFVRILADTVQHPQEIWQVWEADPTQAGTWQLMRSYLQFLNLTDMGVDAEYGVAIVRFKFNRRWELDNMRVQLGKTQLVIDEIQQTVRQGALKYPQPAPA